MGQVELRDVSHVAESSIDDHGFQICDMQWRIQGGARGGIYLPSPTTYN